MSDFNKPTMLMILDGYGITVNDKASAISKANKPELDRIWNQYPRTSIKACGLDVGLPEGQMGNSEVGHLNIGAGRIVYQDLTKITKAINDSTFDSNSSLCGAMQHVLDNNSSLHIMGLLSDGGVHSHIDHLKALITMAASKGITKVYLHAFLDGRDVPPRCALKYIAEIEAAMTKYNCGNIATVSGRYYAMDRDKHWERIQKTYDAMTLREGQLAESATAAVEAGYNRDENDEFITPSVIEGLPQSSSINNNDAIIMFNFRPDRAREITRAFVADDFDGFEREVRVDNLYYVCMTQYDAQMPAVHIAFPPQTLTNTLGEYIADLGLHQLRIAETEKYAHVTFFFNGGVEAPNRNEDRILVPSPQVATFDLKPQMSAYEVTDKVIEQIEADKYDLIILNFANADMVGHTGIMEAAVKAIETLNDCVPRIEKAVLAHNGQILLTADHGNADQMLDDNGAVVTAHSLNDVPLIHIANNPLQLAPGGKLADLAPTLLDLMHLSAPSEMTGKSLIIRGE